MIENYNKIVSKFETDIKQPIKKLKYIILDEIRRL
jgi:hypothetical protein